MAVKKKHQSKIIKRIAVGALVCVPALGWWAERMARMPIPAGMEPAAVLQASAIQTQGNLRRWSECTAFVRDGISACFLQGQPGVRGAALARFFPQEFTATENHLLLQLKRYQLFPGFGWLWLHWKSVRRRHCTQALPLEIQQELYGFSLCAPNTLPWYGSLYGRLWHIQSSYDEAHFLNQPEILAGSALGLTREQTSSHHPLLAYNLDVKQARTLDQNKIVMWMQPEKGHAFVGVGWPGMFGVVAGVNDAGLGVAVLPAPSTPGREPGLPITLLARELLARAATLPDALALVEATPVMVSESILLGSAKENRFVVAEKSPRQLAIRSMENGVITAVQQLLAAHAADALNQGKTTLPSGAAAARLRRIQELLYLQTEPVSVAAAIDILRDPNGEYGARLGTGHPYAINSLSAVASLVMDLESKQIWISQGPHQLGKYVPFAVEDFIAYPESNPVAEDAFLASGKFGNYLNYCRGVEAAEKFYRLGKYQESLAQLQEIQAQNPWDYYGFYLAGNSLLALGRYDEAVYNYQQSRKLQPAFVWEKEKIEKQMEKALKSAE